MSPNCCALRNHKALSEPVLARILILSMLSKKQKTKVIEKFRAHDQDTGSVEVQMAVLTEEIKRLTVHLKKHAKDNHSRRGLLQMVSKRKIILDYLKREDLSRYEALSKKLGLKARLDSQARQAK